MPSDMTPAHLDHLCREAMRRVTEQANRSAGQHALAVRRLAQKLKGKS